MEEITQLLNQVDANDKENLKEAFYQLHSELRILARSRIYTGPEQTMPPTALAVGKLPTFKRSISNKLLTLAGTLRLSSSNE